MGYTIRLSRSQSIGKGIVREAQRKSNQLVDLIQRFESEEENEEKPYECDIVRILQMDQAAEVVESVGIPIA